MALDPVYLRAAASGDPAAHMGLALKLSGEAAAHYESGNIAVGLDLMAQAEVFAVLGTQHGGDVQSAALGGVWFARADLIELEGDPVRALHFRTQARDIFEELNDTTDTDALSMIAVTLAAYLRDREDADAADKLASIIGRLPAEAAVGLREWERTWPKQEVAPVTDSIEGNK